MSAIIPQEFIINRGGRDFVLFAGLLNEAHNQGLRCIDTELTQVPSPDNGNVAICRAEVILEQDDEHSEIKKTLLKNFSGIGDASPENVSRNIVPHIIRMAETRAKARALRDAINVGMTALEELSGEEGDQRNAQRSSRPDLAKSYDDRRITQENVTSGVRKAQREASGAANVANGVPVREGQGPGQGPGQGQRPPTTKQLNYLKSLIDDSVDGGEERFKELAGAPVEELSRHDVSEWIGKLSGKGSGKGSG